jgi:hypothetical protein
MKRLTLSAVSLLISSACGVAPAEVDSDEEFETLAQAAKTNPIRLVKSYDWSSGWTTQSAFKVGNKPYLFFMKQAAGTVHITSINDDGTVGARVDERDWSSGWTSARFFYGGGSTYLFLLKASSGLVHIHKMKSDGKVGELVFTADWGTGWDVAEFFWGEGGQFLFLCKPATGLVHIHRMGSDGRVGERVHTETLEQNSTQKYTNFVFGEPRERFSQFVRMGSRTNGFDMRELEGSGKLGWFTYFANGPAQEPWTLARYYWAPPECDQCLIGARYLYVYDAETGTATYRKVDVDGLPAGVRFEATYGKNWNDMDFYYVGGKTYAISTKTNGAAVVEEFLK